MSLAMEPSPAHRGHQMSRIGIIFGLHISSLYADPAPAPAASNTSTPSNSSAHKENTTTIEVTAIGPGMTDCKPVKGRDSTSLTGALYECKVNRGMGGFESMVKDILSWVIKIVLLLSVLMVVGLGIAWSVFGGGDEGYAKSLKSWTFNIIVGILILFLSYPILMFLAPWAFK